MPRIREKKWPVGLWTAICDGRAITTSRSHLMRAESGRIMITERILQTEVIIIVLPKGLEGVDRCQTAVCQRTIGVWTRKDSRYNVQANMARF